MIKNFDIYPFCRNTNIHSRFCATVNWQKLLQYFKLAFKFKAIPHFKSIGHATEN